MDLFVSDPSMFSVPGHNQASTCFFIATKGVRNAVHQGVMTYLGFPRSTAIAPDDEQNPRVRPCKATTSAYGMLADMKHGGTRRSILTDPCVAMQPRGCFQRVFKS